MIRIRAAFYQISLVGWLCFFFIFIFYFSNASAAPPTLCFQAPTAQPFYSPGERIYVEYESPDYGEDPEHTQVFALNFSYRWEGSSHAYFVHTADHDEFKSGSFFWETPSVNPISTYLTIVAHYNNEQGEILSEWESDVIRILPDSEPALHILRPSSVVSPSQSSSPPCYFYHRVVQGGTSVMVAWRIGGCSSVTNENNWLQFEVTTNGSTYSEFATVDDPCDASIALNWDVPEVNTTLARLRITWWEFIPKVGPRQITSTRSRHHFEITTGAIPHPPVAIAGQDQTVAANERVYLDGCDSYDPDPDDTISYEWTRVDAMRGAFPTTLSHSRVCAPFFQSPCVNSSITLRFNLSVRDGLHTPVTDEVDITVLPSEDDPDGDCADSDSDNCPTVANPGQEDGDNDDVGDVCDICPDDYDPLQQNHDGDGKGDRCDPCPYDAENDSDGDGYCNNLDNCPERANPEQEDWDDDGEGDACDWNDGFKGPFEDAADCGWDSPNPCPTDACQRLIYHGDSDYKIDVVLIPAEDYFIHYPWEGSALYMAIKDGMEDFANSYLQDPVMGSERNRTKYNLWYTRSTIGGLFLNAEGKCDWDDGDWKDDCPDGDTAFIIHVTYCRDSRRGDAFSTTAGKAGIMLHESGHALYDLGDEYDDSSNDCGTHYHEANPRDKSNIWRTESRCENNTSLEADDCHRFTTCQSQWYKAQTGFTMMRGGCKGPDEVSDLDDYPYAICEWGDDAQRQVDDVLSEYDSSLVIRSAAAEGAETDDRKGLLAEFHYDGAGITLTGIHAVNGGGPERVVQRSEGLRMVVENRSGTVISEFTVMDPRYIDYADPLGGGWFPEVDFSEVIPFYDGSNLLKVVDIVSENILGVFDISSAAQSLCAQYPDHSQCRCEGDLNGDRDVDGQDLAEFGEACQAGDHRADLNGDQAVNEEDVKIFARKFGRTFCPDPNPANCDDGDLCTRDFFDPVANKCIHQPKKCYDGSYCTTDLCNSNTGECIYVQKGCSDGLPCTLDTCDRLTGECRHAPLDCDNGNFCTNDFCNPQSGQCVHKTLTCNDGSYCTTDQCDPVVGCYYLEKDCDDDEACTTDSCDPDTGECLHIYRSKCQACCNEGQCTDMTVFACELSGGTPMGAGKTCANTNCIK